jgi:hypothetical protein
MATKEVKEIEILTPEQIERLPDTVHDNVVFLTENVRPQELVKLNPLVSELLNMRDHLSKLEVVKDKDGKITKDSIDDYKELLKTQRSFNGTLTKTAKVLQKPYQDINKGFIEIKKTFKEESDKVKEAAEEIFAEYEEEKARKAAEQQAKKDAALNAQIEEANREAEELKNKTKISNTYNEIKFTQIAYEITEKTQDAILESNEESLNRFKAGIAQKTFEKATMHLDVSILDADVLSELKMNFAKAKRNAILSIDQKLESYALQREKAILEAKQNVPAPPIPPVPSREELDDNKVALPEDEKRHVYGINDIRLDIEEGKLLFAALHLISVELYTNKTPGECLSILNNIKIENKY